ncbi:hypothetical protein MHAE_05432 [Mycobacterium haemophilum DSM 44634]|uniref:hypothetical protein n=1 Tax=Mycobacterium haemophilum TaxID=29311 RepID=UPI0006D5CC78|nr:hypothetical protein [Mycobacterium haemophilum]MCV7339887.1 hypothetical protein [Mycobacterium haemophilum DSM 44634]
MLKTTHTVDSAASFAITVNGTPIAFRIDDDAFTRWMAAEGDGLERDLPNPADDCAGSALSDLVYRALSAGVLVGDPGIELNVHGHTDGAGYLVRLNAVAGHQRLVGLTRGRHELLWPPNDLSPSQDAYRYLQEICDVANSLLNDLLAPSA